VMSCSSSRKFWYGTRQSCSSQWYRLKALSPWMNRRRTMFRPRTLTARSVGHTGVVDGEAGGETAPVVALRATSHRTVYLKAEKARWESST
jgi:hypothetical protein